MEKLLSRAWLKFGQKESVRGQQCLRPPGLVGEDPESYLLGVRGGGVRLLQDKDSRIFPWIASQQAESTVLVMGSTRRNGMKS